MQNTEEKPWGHDLDSGEARQHPGRIFTDGNNLDPLASGEARRKSKVHLLIVTN